MISSPWVILQLSGSLGTYRSNCLCMGSPAYHQNQFDERIQSLSDCTVGPIIAAGDEQSRCMRDPIVCYMTPFEFGKFTFENLGAPAIVRVITNQRPGYSPPSFLNSAAIVAGAASYYNPYLQAAAAVPVVYQGAKWLWDKVT